MRSAPAQLAAPSGRCWSGLALAKLLLLAPVAYLVLPGHQLAWFSGLPLTPIALATLVLFAVLVYACWPIPAERYVVRLVQLMLLLCLVKIAIGRLSPTYGLEASYFAKLGGASTPERSTVFTDRAFSRLDTALRFADDTFPLYFFNDNQRFNYYRDDEPDRNELPFEARWHGLIDVPADGEYHIWLTAAGSAELDLPGAVSARLESQQPDTVMRAVQLTAGIQPLDLHYLRRAGERALLAVEWDREGARQTLAAPYLLSQAAGPNGPVAGHLTSLARLVDVAFLVSLCWLVLWLLRNRVRRALPSALDVAPEPCSPVANGLDLRRSKLERGLLASLLAVFFVYAALSSLPLKDRAVMLDAGSDFLTYEAYAREILLNGPLMTLGRSLGKGRPYVFQPFYPYLVAAAHWLTGEDLYGVVVLQLFGIGIATVLVYQLTKRLFDVTSAICALLLVLCALWPFQLDLVGRQLLSEGVYFWMLPAAALSLLEMAERPTWRSAALAGALLGISSITRAPTLAWVLPALLVVYLRLRRHFGPSTGQPRRPARIAAIALASCSAIVMLVPLRNYVVAGQPALMATNGVATMELAHQPTSAVDLRAIDRNPVYRALGLNYSTSRLIEFVRQDPAGYAATLWPLGLYALGLPQLLEPGSPVRWELAGLVALYVAYLAIWLAERSRRSADRFRESAPAGDSLWASPILHAFVGLHFGAMMVFLPNVYGYRQALPMYIFLAVFGGRTVARLALFLRDSVRRSTEQQHRCPAQRGGVERYVKGAGGAAGHEELA